MGTRAAVLERRPESAVRGCGRRSLGQVATFRWPDGRRPCRGRPSRWECQPYARDHGGSHPSDQVCQLVGFHGTILALRMCLDSLYVQPLSPVNNLRVVYRYNGLLLSTYFIDSGVHVPHHTKYFDHDLPADGSYVHRERLVVRRQRSHRDGGDAQLRHPTQTDQ
jgi:hypothetical protein